jgi:hypothetical protein
MNNLGERETNMPTIRKKITLGLFLGLFLTYWTLGMTLILPQEILLFDNTLSQSIKAPSEELDQVRVIKPNAVLRIKPKTGAVIIKKLPLGALLDKKEEIGDWLMITLPPDEDDFILSGYLLRSFTEKSTVIHE